MSYRFDSPADTGSLIFDHPYRPGYLQDERSFITLTSTDIADYVGVFEHALGAHYDVYSAGTHEYIPEGIAPGYTQSAPSIITLISTGTHEYVPIVIVYDQANPTPPYTPILTLSDVGYHVHWPGGPDYIQTGDDRYTLSDNGTHSFLASTYVASSEHVIAYVERWLDSTPSDVVVDFSSLAEVVNRVTFLLECTNDLYVYNSGPTGGSVSVVIEVVTDTEVLPIVSLSNDYPRATIFNYGDLSENFIKMSTAMAAGPVTLRLGGYEGLTDRTLPLRLSGESTLTVEALVAQ